LNRGTVPAAQGASSSEDDPRSRRDFSRGHPPRHATSPLPTAQSRGLAYFSQIGEFPRRGRRRLTSEALPALDPGPTTPDLPGPGRRPTGPGKGRISRTGPCRLRRGAGALQPAHFLWPSVKPRPTPYRPEGAEYETRRGRRLPTEGARRQKKRLYPPGQQPRANLHQTPATPLTTPEKVA